MALRWYEGFESARTSSNLTRRYGGVVNLPSISFVAGRLHGFALTTSSSTLQWVETPSWTNHATCVVGVAYRTDAFNPPNGMVLANIMDGAQSNITIQTQQGTINTNNVRFKVMVGATQLAISSEFPPGLNTFYYVELKVVLATGATGSYTLKVNEVTEATGSSVVTAQFTAVHNRVRFGIQSNGSQNSTIDDMYVCDGSGAIRNDFLGDTVAETILPDSDITGVWTTFPSVLGAGVNHWDKVDDPANVNYDDDATAIVSTADGQQDIFGFANLTFLQGSFLGVMVEIQARLTTSGSRNFHATFRDSGGTFSDGATITLTSTSYIPPKFTIFQQNPITVANWTLSDINGGGFGVETG